MLQNFFTLLFIIMTFHITVSLQQHENPTVSTNEHIFARQKRAVKKPGFFKTLFSVIGEQYTDTKSTFQKVNELINDNFIPENGTSIKVTEKSVPSDSNETTTAAPYKITRSDLNKIIRRNLRGLVRLFNIELEDALKQSKITRAEYKKALSKEASKFL